VSRGIRWCLLMFSTRYGISIKACRLSLPRSSHCCQVSHHATCCVYADSPDPSERSKSHSTSDKPTQNEVNTPHYLAQKVYPSVGPGLVEVWVEAIRQDDTYFIPCLESIPKTVVHSLIMSSLLYMGMHHYSLVRYLILITRSNVRYTIITSGKNISHPHRLWTTDSCWTFTALRRFWN
jgi:hypothetical protein